mmetsp:Transcript_14580/g.31786  ORF Transcript_14580/g.31786 Transcript_14580/m.31786 type:complete len:96 (-) Transcript_14580:1058-1345(-)
MVLARAVTRANSIRRAHCSSSSRSQTHLTRVCRHLTAVVSILQDIMYPMDKNMIMYRCVQCTSLHCSLWYGGARMNEAATADRQAMKRDTVPWVH